MLKRKKVTPTILAFIATLCFSIGPFVSAASADTKLYATSHGYDGTLTWVVIDMTEQGATGNGSSNYGNLCRTEMTINFSDCQDGTFYINFNESNTQVTFLCDNCELTSTGLNEYSHLQASFEFHGQNTMTIVAYYYTSSTVPTLLYPTSWGGSWNRVAISEINAIAQISHNLTLYLYDSVNGVDYLGEIYESLEDLNSSVDDVEDLLRSIQNTSMYNIEPYQHAAWIYASKYDTQFPRWKYGLPYMSYSTSYNSSNYTASHGIRLANGYSYAMMFYSSKALSASDVTLYYNGTGNVSISTVPITEINSQLYLMGFIFKNERNGFSSFEAEFGQTFELYPLYFGLTNNIPDEVRALFGLEYDNTYTRLLQQISNGISALQSDQTTIDNSTNVTNNFNTEITKINNVELNILSGIQDKFTAVNTAIENSGVLQYPNQPTVLKGWVNNMSAVVFDNFNFIKYPVYIILVGFVLLCLLG